MSGTLSSRNHSRRAAWATELNALAKSAVVVAVVVAGVVVVVVCVCGGVRGSAHVVRNHWDSALAFQHSYTLPSAILSAKVGGLLPPSKNDWPDTPEHHF